MSRLPHLLFFMLAFLAIISCGEPTPEIVQKIKHGNPNNVAKLIHGGVDVNFVALMETPYSTWPAVGEDHGLLRY